jgi:hypothetical protein
VDTDTNILPCVWDEFDGVQPENGYFVVPINVRFSPNERKKVGRHTRTRVLESLTHLPFFSHPFLFFSDLPIAQLHLLMWPLKQGLLTIRGIRWTLGSHAKAEHRLCLKVCVGCACACCFVFPNTHAGGCIVFSGPPIE